MKINSYHIEQVNPVYSADNKLLGVKLRVLINSEQTGWLVCEGRGGAMTLWEQDPGEAYEDLMHELWNASIDRAEPGYATEQVGIYDQYIFPVESCVYFDRLEEQIAQTEYEQELWFKANQIYETFSWSAISDIADLPDDINQALNI